MKKCPSCGKEVTAKRRKYCDAVCQLNYNIAKKSESRKPARRAYAKQNRNRTYMRRKLLEINYGLSEEAYSALEQSQNYKCKICSKHKDYVRHGVLVVDHDHTTGRVRGLLCGQCNSGLGFFRDNIANLQNAINYLAE